MVNSFALSASLRPAERIFDQFINLKSYFNGILYEGVDLSAAPMHWLGDQDAWIRQQVKASAKKENDALAPRWRAVGLLQEQFRGLVEGYQARAQAEGASNHSATTANNGSDTVGWLELSDLFFLINNGELYDILDHLDSSNKLIRYQRHGKNINDSASLGPHIYVGDISGSVNVSGPSSRSVFNRVAMRGRCSALIKLLPDLSDVFVGHSTWDQYTSALRIYKHYEFNLNDKVCRLLL